MQAGRLRTHWLQGFFHHGANLLVEDFLVAFVGVAFVVAAGEEPEDDDEVLGGYVAGDGLEGGAVGLEEDNRGVALHALGEVVGAVAAVGRVVGLSEPGDGFLALGVELDGVEILVEDFGHGGVGEGLAVHLLAVATPVGVEVDEVHLGTNLGFGGLVDGVPGHLRHCRGER